jgi:hypothetical protein
MGIARDQIGAKSKSLLRVQHLKSLDSVEGTPSVRRAIFIATGGEMRPALHQEGNVYRNQWRDAALRQGVCRKNNCSYMESTSYN